MKKKILIDINSTIPYFMLGHTTGVGRSTLELISALSKIKDLPFDITLYSQNTRGIKFGGQIPLKEFHMYLPNKEPIRKIVNKLHLKSLFTHYDLLHIPHNIDLCENYNKTIFTIHDLIVYRYPEQWGATEEDLLRLQEIGQKCKAIITCSESSKKDILNFWELPDKKVKVIPWGINREKFRPIEDIRCLKKYGITSSYYFSSSCNHPRKNTSILLRAFEQYIDLGGSYQLVLLNPNKEELIGFNALIDQKRVIICRNVSDDELVALYSHAHSSIVASSYEGFGLPVLESLACGTQVLCAKNSSIIEAGGSVVSYFEELEANCICSKMMKYESLDKHNTYDRVKTEAHLDRFTWKKCAESYVLFYEELLLPQ